MTPLAAMAVVQPALARSRILEALEACKGSRREAAKLLKTPPATLYRCVARLRMWGAIDELIERRGFTPRAGAERKDKP